MTSSHKSPLKLVLALAALGGALVVLWNGLAPMLQGEGADAATADLPDPWADISGEADEPADALPVAAAAADPARSLPPAARPDWQGLFQLMVEREQELDRVLDEPPEQPSPEVVAQPEPEPEPVAVVPAPAPVEPEPAPEPAPIPVDHHARLAGVTVSGIVLAGRRAAALVDGRVLHVGDALPGTRDRLTVIAPDRITVQPDDDSEPVELLLRPLQRGAPTPTPTPVSTPVTLPPAAPATTAPATTSELPATADPAEATP